MGAGMQAWHRIVGDGVADTWTIQRVLTWTGDYFRKKDLDAPRLTAELLLAHALGCDRVRLYTDYDRPLNKDELAAYRGLVDRRAKGEPTFYLTGAREFFGHRFQVDARVLVPRPETELLVEAALERLPADFAGEVLDLCTGSGCVGLSLASERAQLKLVATDLSAEALAVARANALALELASRVELVQGDLFAPLGDRLFALIVANPPYIESATLATLAPEVRSEPRLALDGGPDGLAIVRRIVVQASGHLPPQGWLLLEIGDGQGPALLELLAGAGLAEASIRKDLAGLDRIALARRP
jgi:release factor glutamine methyltransferase